MLGGEIQGCFVEDVRPGLAVFFGTVFVGAVAHAFSGTDEDHANRAQPYELHPVVRGAAREIVGPEPEPLARRQHRVAHLLRTGDRDHPLQDLRLETYAAPLARFRYAL